MWPARSRFCLRIGTLALCHTREEPNLHLELYLTDVIDGMRSRNFLLTVAKKTVSAYSRLLGWVSIQVLSRTLIMSVVAGVFERGSPVRNARVIFRCSIATTTLKGSFVVCDTYTVTSRRKSGRLFIDLSLMEKRAKRTHDHFARTFFLEIEVCKRKVRSGFRLHSRISLSEASFLIFFIKPARKFVVEPPITVGLSLISASVTDADTCPFS